MVEEMNIAPPYRIFVATRPTIEMQIAMKKFEPVAYRGDDYFIDSIDASGLYLIIIDDGVKKILEWLQQGRFKTTKLLTGKKTFVCAGCGLPKAIKGRTYGTTNPIKPNQYYCVNCTINLNVIPFQDKWIHASTMINKKRKSQRSS